MRGMREEHQSSGYQVTEKCNAQTGNEVIYLHQVIEVCKCYQNDVGVNISYHSLFVALSENIINMSHQSYIIFLMSTWF